MNELIAKFAQIMDEECALYEELLQLSREKQEAVTEQSLSKLDHIVREEQMRLAKQQGLEKRRVACVSELSKLTGQPVGDITMLTFAEAAPPEQKGNLRALAEKLSDTLNHLKKNNDINSRMLESRLEYIQCMLSSASAMQESGVYTPKGTESPQAGKAAKLYDKKV